MCALKLGVSAEMELQNMEKNIKFSNEKLKSIHRLLDNIGEVVFIDKISPTIVLTHFM